MTKKNNEDDFEQFAILGEPQSRVSSRTYTNSHSDYTVRIDGPIVEPSDYREEMYTLENAGPEDTVYIPILSGGGRIATGIMLINAIKNCQATTIAEIHEECGSMATGIALACDIWKLYDYSHFFIHTASWGSIGKDQEVRSQVAFMDKYLDRFLKNTYSGFLTAKEIGEVAKGGDMWIDTDELKIRLAKYAEYRRIQGEKEFKRKEKERKQMEKLYAQTAD